MNSEPIICTWCNEAIEPGTKFLVVYNDEHGFRLYEGCMHREGRIRQMIRWTPPLGIAGSMSCLGNILIKYAEDCKNHATDSL